MAEYRTIRMSCWTDPYMESLEPEEKLLYLYLFSCPHTNNLGVMEVSRKRIAFETGIDLSRVNAYLSHMVQAGKLIEADGLMWMSNFIKHQTTTSPKILESLKALVAKVPSPTIRKAICMRYPHIFDGCDTVPIPYADGTPTPPIPSGEVGSWKKEEEREEEEEETPPLPPHRPTASATPPPGGDGPSTEPSGSPGSPVLLAPPSPRPKRADGLKAIALEVVDAYHAALPELPQCREVKSVVQALTARMRDDPARQTLAWWQRLFQEIRGMPFLMGQVATSGRTAFTCTLAWIAGPQNLSKILNGQYRQRDGPPSTGSALTDQNMRAVSEWLAGEGFVMGDDGQWRDATEVRQ